MPHLIKQDSSSNKKTAKSSKTSGRFASPEEAARAKNADLVAHIKKIGLKIIEITPAQ